MATDKQNGWNEYSKLVLKELESLNDTLDTLSLDLQEVKKDIARLQAKEDKVDEIRAWKDRFDDVASPSQLQSHILSIEELKTFRTKAITIFAVVQFGMAVAIWLMKVTG
jgi:predicted nuclease with TOPRIM domain